MPACTVVRTHRNGRKLAQRDWDQPIAGPVQHQSTMHPELKRFVPYLRITRVLHGGLAEKEPIPRLYEPRVPPDGSDRACLFARVAEIVASRYYPGGNTRWG